MRSVPQTFPELSAPSGPHVSTSTCTGWCPRESAVRSIGGCSWSSRCVSAAGMWTRGCRPFASLPAQASPRPSPDLVWSRWSSFLFELIKLVRALLAAAAQRLHQRHEARAGRAAAEGELARSAARRCVPLGPVPLPFLPCSPRAPLRIWPSVRLAARKLTDDGFAHDRRARDRRRPPRWQRPSFGRRRRSQRNSGGEGSSR